MEPCEHRVLHPRAKRRDGRMWCRKRRMFVSEHGCALCVRGKLRAKPERVGGRLPDARRAEIAKRRAVCRACPEGLPDADGIRVSCAIAKCVEPASLRPRCPVFRWGDAAYMPASTVQERE